MQALDPLQHPTGGPKREAVVYTKATVQDFLERYEVGETVGVGGFAVVKRGRDKVTSEPVAIKVVDKSRYAAGDNSLEREIQVLCKVDHPNCIKLYAVYITGRKVYIVTELVTGGELLDRVTEKGNYTEMDAAHIIRQILQGVQYLHSHGIVHRDLKLENMVMLNQLDDSPVKIADFGLSKFFSNDNVLSTMCGSPQYVAPEVLGVGDGLKEYSPAVDMWSVGVILFILLSGYSPFDDDNDAVLFEKIKSGNYDADDPIWENISAEAKDVVAKLLTVDAEARLTADEALAHPWVQGMCFEPQRKGGNKQLQSAMDKMKSMAVKRESMRQLSFKQAGEGHAGPGAPAAADAGAGAAAGAAPPATVAEEDTEGAEGEQQQRQQQHQQQDERPALSQQQQLQEQLEQAMKQQLAQLQQQQQQAVRQQLQHPATVGVAAEQLQQPVSPSSSAPQQQQQQPVASPATSQQ
uniref:Protein kinase domain-containing protein n=1 Tax=Tetradesmus obliquus TaxID=3088 RepID=A0A383VKX5_TETOB|eukprot:jgi/Sobl393_1/10064/SZX65382.1